MTKRDVLFETGLGYTLPEITIFDDDGRRYFWTSSLSDDEEEDEELSSCSDFI